MAISHCAFATACLLLASHVTAKSSTAPDNVSSRLMIHIPHSLYREDGYDHREALFGMPAYGGSLALPVIYTNSSLCGDELADKTKFKPARKASDADPYILMMDRGGCTFVEKVRKAQNSGAAAVVVADNVCWCSDTECQKKSGSTICESQEPIMADDGSGNDVSIPSFLMFKADADLVKDEIMQGRPVQMEMAWSLPTPDDRVEYDLWTTPSDKVAKDFFGDFRPLVDSLGDSAYFTPHMYIYNGSKSGCTLDGMDDISVCGNLCTNSGRYCATDPDNDLERGVTGADVVRESLRRICIWQEYGRDGQGTKWWEYVKVFNERCNDEAAPGYFNDVACIKDVMKKAKVDVKKIDKCMIDSGGVDNNGATNDYLEWEMANQTQKGVIVIPTAFINAAAIRGALTSGNVFAAICSGFSKGTAPKACKCSGCGEPAKCIANRYKCPHAHSTSYSSTAEGGVSTGFFSFSMLVVICGFTAAGIWHYKRTKDEMREQVRGILAEYMPLEDNDVMNGSMMNGSPMAFSQGGQTTSLIS